MRDLPPSRQISLIDLRFGLKDVVPQKTLDDIEQLLSGLERDGVVRRKGQRVALAL